MKKLISIAALCFVCAFPLCLFQGCAGQTKVAYQVETGAQVTVETAMTAWGDYVKAHHPPASDELKVKLAYEKYQMANVAAVDATSALASLTDTNSVPRFSLIASDATASAATALTELINVIKTFGIKL